MTIDSKTASRSAAEEARPIPDFENMTASESRELAGLDRSLPFLNFR